MPEQSTLCYLADLVIQKVLMDADTEFDLGEALERAYTFDSRPATNWMDALLRHGITSTCPKALKTGPNQLLFCPAGCPSPVAKIVLRTRVGTGGASGR